MAEVPGQEAAYRLKITIISNAGLLMEYRGTKLLVDAIYGKEGHPFSNLSTSQWERMLGGKAPFDGIDYVLVTHDHPDHFSSEMMLRYLRSRKVKGLFLPSEGVRGTILEHYIEQNRIPCVELSEFTNRAKYQIEPHIQLSAMRMHHLDRKYRNVANYCYLLRFDQKNVLITADVDYVHETFTDLKDTPLHAVFVNPLFFNELRGRHFFRGTLDADHYCVYHLPFPGDDKVIHMGHMTERNVQIWNSDPKRGGAMAFTERGQKLEL